MIDKENLTDATLQDIKINKSVCRSNNQPRSNINCHQMASTIILIFILCALPSGNAANQYRPFNLYNQRHLRAAAHSADSSRPRKASSQTFTYERSHLYLPAAFDYSLWMYIPRWPLICPLVTFHWTHFLLNN